MSAPTLSEVLARARTTAPEILVLLDRTGDLEEYIEAQVVAGRYHELVIRCVERMGLRLWREMEQHALEHAAANVHQAMHALGHAVKLLDKFVHNPLSRGPARAADIVKEAEPAAPLQEGLIAPHAGGEDARDDG